MKRPRTSTATRRDTVQPGDDVPPFDPREHGWTGDDGGLGHANDVGSLPAASWAYARAAVTGGRVSDLATAALTLYRSQVLGLSARDVVAARHPRHGNR